LGEPIKRKYVVEEVVNLQLLELYLEIIPNTINQKRPQLNKPDIQIIETEDGSKSVYSNILNETYHSKHGAIQESMHVFINSGLLEVACNINQINILEVGFGTGLNSLLTLKKCDELQLKVDYYALEPFPLPKEITSNLDYNIMDDRFGLFHILDNSNQVINDHFQLFRINKLLEDFINIVRFDLVYYDAFGPPVQPEMWELEVFEKLFLMMNAGGIIVTYCAKGSVRRSMIEAGFTIERLQGPPGKREMLRGTKPIEK